MSERDVTRLYCPTHAGLAPRVVLVGSACDESRRPVFLTLECCRAKDVQAPVEVDGACLEGLMCWDCGELARFALEPAGAKEEA